MSPITATAARLRFEELLSEAAENDATFVVERDGQPTAVLMSIACYDDLVKAGRGARVERALDDARKLREEIAQRTAGKTFPSAAEMIREAREERDEQLTGHLR